MVPRFGLVTRLGLILLTLTLGGVAYGFTAMDAVPRTKAGVGTGPILGYTLSAVQYHLDATNPQNIDSVTMTLTATPTAGSTIKLGLAGSSGETTWYTCTTSDSTVTCPTTAPQATAWGVTNGGTASAGTTSASGTLTLVISD